jgi:hypothetical protein
MVFRKLMRAMSDVDVALATQAKNVGETKRLIRACNFIVYTNTVETNSASSNAQVIMIPILGSGGKSYHECLPNVK